jgi:hypothetical protein
MLLHNVSTAIILLELRNRIRDQINDPEPQYDACCLIAQASTKRLDVLHGIPQSQHQNLRRSDNVSSNWNCRFC